MDRQQDEQDVEFETFLRQFRPRTPPTFRAVRLKRVLTPRNLGVAAAVLLACAIPVRFLWNQSAAHDPSIGSRREDRSFPTSGGQSITSEGPARTGQEGSALGRALNLIPSVEATLSAFAPPAEPQDRMRMTTFTGRGSVFTARAPAAPRRKVTARVQPAYPPEAKRLGLEAYVVLKLTVNPAGAVTETERISGVVNLHPDEENGSARAEFYAANPYAFTIAAEAAAKQWRFETASSSMTCFVSFAFHLTSGPDLTKSGPARPSSTTLSAVPGSSQPGVVVPSAPSRVDGQVIKPPTRLVSVNPVYPEGARAARIEGVVILEITIGKDGSVASARVLRSIPELDQAAIDAVLQWVYEPTLLNGEPIEVKLNVTINFTLR